ncbi:MAG: hydrogen gas-evolving membrane-bound hydrogenase subunit E [Wenzhouxiangellaceae bacterium]
MKRLAYKLLVAALGLTLLAGLLWLPPPGQPGGPVHEHVAARYVEGGTEAAGAPNLTTAVLLNYRGLDTFGEVTVIFAALLAVLAVLGLGAAARNATGRETNKLRANARLPVSPVVNFIIRLMAPFMATFAAFVMIQGDVLPGGGFQGGVVLGAMMILLAVAIGPARVSGMVAPAPLGWLRATAPLVFLIVAVSGLALSGAWFGLPDQPAPGHALMVVLELAIGMGGAAVITGIYLSLARETE